MLSGRSAKSGHVNYARQGHNRNLSKTNGLKSVINSC